jgi:hypothetical protein
MWLQNVCGLGMSTSHCVIVCNWCISMATLRSIWFFSFAKVEQGKDFPFSQHKKMLYMSNHVYRY